MRALARVHAVVRQPGLHDDSRRGDVRPLHRDAQPRVVASPSSRPHQHVAPSLFYEAAVDAVDFSRYGRIVAGRIPVRLDVDHVVHLVVHALADGVVRAYERLLVGYLRQVFVEHHLVVHHRANLQQVEDAGAVGIQFHGKFYLHFAPHALTPEAQRHPQEFRKREHPLLQHAAERDELAPALVDAVAYHHVGGVERGRDVL